MTIEEFKQSCQGCKVDVLGIGISNTPLIRYLADLGAHVTAHDKKERDALGPICAELEALGVSLCLGEGYLDALDGEIIFKTPGMRFDLPQLVAARARGAHVTSEVEV